MSTTKTTVIATFVIVLTFTAGFLGGAAAHHLFTSRRHPLPPLAARAMVHHLDRRLEFTADQRRAIEAIMRRRHEQMGAELRATHDEIARVLTPGQRAKFEKMRLRFGRPHERHGRP